MDALATSLIANVPKARKEFHRELIEGYVLCRVGALKVASNADADNALSVALARGAADAIETAAGLKLATRDRKLAGQTIGGKFEDAIQHYLDATFKDFPLHGPGNWVVAPVKGRDGVAEISKYRQYAHLAPITKKAEEDAELAAVLGLGYTIAPDVLVSRSIPGLPKPVLHASVSAKWTLRSDRSQNSRTEALTMIRNRKGRLPHVVVVTAEPLPTRLASVALGTGDIDCVYHISLSELVGAAQACPAGGPAKHGTSEALSPKNLLETMTKGERLKDIADLPLDLCL